MKCSNCQETDHEVGAKYCHKCGAQFPVQVHGMLNYKKWFVAFVIIVTMALLYVLYNNISFESEAERMELPQKQVTTDNPQDLSGNYFARKIDGVTNTNAIVKIYREGDGYGLNVYSSNITRKYTFTYNPSTGEIISNGLGSGKARVKELTNETEITFTGWELLK